jgi:ribosome biogenesis protein ENP2
MDVQESNSTRVYALSNGPSLPDWIGERARRNLAKRDSNIRRRIELLQDFSMPAASSKLVQSKDGRFIIAAGTYKPRIRCFELDQLGMKFERYTDADIEDIIMLGDDYGKLAILQSDRTVLFHAPYGQHYSLRIPTFGRQMAYEPSTCELLVSCSGKAGRNSISKSLGGGEVYRINLEEGRFSAPLNYSASYKSNGSNNGYVPVVGGNCISTSPVHAMTALGGDDGIVRFWDNRVQQGGAQDDMNLNPFCTLDVKSSTAGFGFYDENALLIHENPNEVTSLAFDHTGMYLAAGTKGGNVALYDIRSSKPLHVKEHQYGMPIHTLRFHASSGTLLSSDPKLVKIWRTKPSALSTGFGIGDEYVASSGSMGEIVANVEGTANFTNFIVAGDEKDSSGNSSGVVLCTGEQPKMQAFYCPALGSAPRWCSFLDNITEELEEKDRSEEAIDASGEGSGNIYEDYKFLTRSEIDSLGIQNLVGTPLLRGYMHGFFIDIGLYNRIRAVANPFEYEEYRKKKVREKMEEKRASRIAPKQKKKTVNAELAERLEGKSASKNKAGMAAKSLLEDDRFGSLFKNPDFAIDEDDINFKLRNPSGVQAAKMAKDNDMDSDAEESISDTSNKIENFNKIDGDDEDDGWGGSSADDDFYSSSSDDDGFKGARVRGEAYEENLAIENELKKKKKTKIKKKKNIMYEADDYNTGNTDAIQLGLGGKDPISSSKKRKELSNLTLAERLKLKEEESGIIGETRTLRVKGDGTTREVTYIPKSAKNQLQENKVKDLNEAKTKRKRRGIKDLKFKTPFKNKM